MTWICGMPECRAVLPGLSEVIVNGTEWVAMKARIAQLEPANALLQDQVCALANRKDLLEAALSASKIEFLQQWMRAPNPMLGGAVPLDMMYQGMGRRVAQFIDSAYQSETDAYVDRHHGGTTIEEREAMVRCKEHFIPRCTICAPEETVVEPCEVSGQEFMFARIGCIICGKPKEKHPTNKCAMWVGGSTSDRGVAK